MALALPRLPVESAAEILAALAKARTLPATVLRRAVERADEIAPAVVEVVEQAARGVFLMPEQYNLLFWGIHAVGAGQRTELYRPLLRLVHNARTDDLEDLLGDAISETLKKVVISTFDGDPEPLLTACADREVDGFVRWNLMLALVRLTFDGRIAHEATLAFLDRFERDSLADHGDPAWDGWQDAITLLGLEPMRERMRASWMDGRHPQDPPDRDYFERQLTIAQALAPHDAALLEAEGAVPLGDPVEDLEWTLRFGRDFEEDEPDPDDPAAAFALKKLELDWLAAFLGSSKVPPATLTLDAIDGLFSALIAGPGGARIEDCLRVIWNPVDATDEIPTYDNLEQEQYVHSLLRRHWTSIGQRLEQAYPHVPEFIGQRDPRRARGWAAGFTCGMIMRKTDWRLRIDEPAVSFFGQILLCLMMEQEASEAGITLEMRDRLIERLPRRLVALHHTWRGRADPFPLRVAPGRKVGRNERCPCGSGKKFKHCCGAPTS